MAVSHKARTIAMPVAMVVGALFHEFFDRLGFLTPYLIFMMLFITFCRVSVREMKVTRLHWLLLACQIGGGVAIYLMLYRVDAVIAQGLMVCVFTSVAMAAMVIAGMLGANVTTMATFTLMSSLGVAVTAPVLFSFVGTHTEIPFVESVLIILSRVGPLLILPFVAAWVLEKIWPRMRNGVGRLKDISFWLWVLSLTIVIGRTVKFIIAQPSSNYMTELWLAAGALVVCVMQFAVGRWLGRRYGDVAAGGQSLGQKNTVLAIWMAQMYLDPLSSVAPAAYVIWQNVVNSWQLWRYKPSKKE